MNPDIELELESMWRVSTGEIWMHAKKRKDYVVLEILNKDNSLGDDNNPPTVVYMDGEGRKFARSLLKWNESFIRKGTI